MEKRFSKCFSLSEVFLFAGSGSSRRVDPRRGFQVWEAARLASLPNLCEIVHYSAVFKFGRRRVSRRFPRFSISAELCILHGFQVWEAARLASFP